MTPYPGAMSVTPGTMTPGFATSSRIDLNQIGEARNSMLGIKLDQVILQLMFTTSWLSDPLTSSSPSSSLQKNKKQKKNMQIKLFFPFF